MNIKKTNLRFNLDKESDKKAYDFLQSLDKSSYKSVNRFVIYLKCNSFLILNGIWKKRF